MKIDNVNVAYETIIMQINKEICNKEISYPDLAKRMGISRQTMYNIAELKNTCSFENILKLCKELNLDISITRGE